MKFRSLFITADDVKRGLVRKPLVLKTVWGDFLIEWRLSINPPY